MSSAAEKPSRDQIAKQAFVILGKDKELLLFSILSGILTVGSFLLIIYSLYILYFKSAIKNQEFSAIPDNFWLITGAFFLIVALFSILCKIFTGFSDAAVIFTVDERMKGGNPRFEPTMKKLMVRKKNIFRAVMYIIVPFMGEIMIFGWAKRFFLQEMLLHKRSPKEALARGITYAEKSWVQESAINLGWSGISMILFAAGIAIPLSLFSLVRIFHLIDYDNNNAITVLVIILLSGTVLYFCLYSLVMNTIIKIYETIIYKHYVENEKAESNEYRLILRNVDTGSESHIKLH